MSNKAVYHRRHARGVILHRLPGRGGDVAAENQASGGRTLLHRQVRRAEVREVRAEVREYLAGAL